LHDGAHHERIPSLIRTRRADPNLTAHKYRMPFRIQRAPTAQCQYNATRSLHDQFASLQSISADLLTSCGKTAQL